MKAMSVSSVGVRAKMEKIGPAEAFAILDQSSGFRNRPLDKARVSQYRRAMESGRWMPNGEPIILDRDGVCIDGQHRLRAILESGVEVEILVVRGVERSVFSTIDQGKQREAQFLLREAGYRNGSLCAAAIRTYLTWESRSFSNSSRRIDNQTVLEYAPQLPNLREMVHRVQAHADWLPVPATVTAAFLIIQNYGGDEAACREFIDGVLDGCNLSKGDPEMALRERLRRMKPNRAERDEVLYLVLRAWMSFCACEKLVKLQLPSLVGQEALDSVDPRKVVSITSGLRRREA